MTEADKKLVKINNMCVDILAALGDPQCGHIKHQLSQACINYCFMMSLPDKEERD